MTEAPVTEKPDGLAGTEPRYADALEKGPKKQLQPGLTDKLSVERQEYTGDRSWARAAISGIALNPYSWPMRFR